MMTLKFLQKMMVIITAMRTMIYFLLLLLKISVQNCCLLHLLVMHQMHQKILILILMRISLKRQKRKLYREIKRFSVNKILLNGEILTCQVLRDLPGLVVRGHWRQSDSRQVEYLKTVKSRPSAGQDRWGSSQEA